MTLTRGGRVIKVYSDVRYVRLHAIDTRNAVSVARHPPIRVKILAWPS